MRNHDKQYMDMANIWAKNSYAIRSKVGALIVKDGAIISDGYNGTPSGFDNTCEEAICNSTYRYGCVMTAEPPEPRTDLCKDCEWCELRTKPEVLHAEANAITKLAKSTQSSEGSTLYVTLSPCAECAKLIIQAGIKRVVYKDLYRKHDGIDLLKRANITVDQLD